MNGLNTNEKESNMPRLSQTPSTRFLLSGSHPEGPTLESALTDIMADLNAKTECLNNEIRLLSESLATETDLDASDVTVEKLNLFRVAAFNNNEIVVKLQDCLEIQTNTIIEFKQYDLRLAAEAAFAADN
jgi:uncharacterized protein involved in propanediol utilization